MQSLFFWSGRVGHGSFHSLSISQPRFTVDDACADPQQTIVFRNFLLPCQSPVKWLFSIEQTRYILLYSRFTSTAITTDCTDKGLSQTLLTVEAETFSITKMTSEVNTDGTEAQEATINPEEQPSGRCLCGKTSYRITMLDDRSPGQILVCHCSLCRRGSGALCVPFAAFPRYH